MKNEAKAERDRARAEFAQLSAAVNAAASRKEKRGLGNFLDAVKGIVEVVKIVKTAFV